MTETNSAPEDNEAVKAMRKALIDVVEAAYRQFHDAVSGVPGHMLYLQHAHKCFSEGRYWMSQAVLNAVITHRNLNTHDMDGNPLPVEPETIAVGEPNPTDPINAPVNDPEIGEASR